MAQKKLALSLRGGGAHYGGHLGAIQALMDHDIEIHMAIGASVGALIAGCMAADKTIEEMKELGEQINLRKLISLNFLKDQSVTDPQKILKQITEIVGEKELADAPIRTWLQATNVDTGEIDYIGEGDVAHAMTAAVCLPLLTHPFEWNGKRYFDMAGSYGVEFLRNQGADVIVALEPGDSKTENLPNPTNFPMRSLFLMSLFARRIMVLDYANNPPDVLLTDLAPGGDFLDFKHGDEYYDQGYEVAKKQIPEIKKLLKKGLFSFG